LVSLSSNITRILHVALAKLFDEEPAETIVITFINPPRANKSQYHSARSLAEELGFKDSHLFSTEYLAEGEINPGAVQHSITLRTLIDRGLFSDWNALDKNITNSDDLHHYIGNMLFESNMNPYKIGLALGSFVIRTSYGCLRTIIARQSALNWTWLKCTQRTIKVPSR
jgi:hypothetical protein